MLILKEVILFAVTTFLTSYVHAGHKRIVIRVPQRTQHIYHHHVKKIPVYIILPDKKPKVLHDFEELTQQSHSQPLPCKDAAGPVTSSPASSSWQDDRSSSRYRYARYTKRENDAYQAAWTEDKENKGAYLPADSSYRTIDQDIMPPPLLDEQELPFRRANNDEYDDSRNSNYDYLRNDQSRDYSNKNASKNAAKRPTVPDSYREAYESVVSFTYPPAISGANSKGEASTSYQYRIGHRMDTNTSITR